MSYNKNQFIKLLNEYKALAKKNQETLKNFMENNDYTEEYKGKAKEAAQMQMAQYKEQYEKLLNGIIDNAISSVNNKITQRATDPQYQLALSNAFRMVELAGKEMDSREFQALVKPFANDEMASKAFRGIVAKIYPDSADQHKFSSNLLSGTDEKTIKNLEEIKTNISKALDPVGPTDPFSGTPTYEGREVYLNGIEDYISNKTNDDFGVISE